MQCQASILYCGLLATDMVWSLYLMHVKYSIKLFVDDRESSQNFIYTLSPFKIWQINRHVWLLLTKLKQYMNKLPFKKS